MRVIKIFLPSCALGLLLWSLFAASWARAEQPHPTEPQIEAAYLYNFGKFVTWSNFPADAAFEICVLGKDPFGPILDSTVAGESIGDKKITTRKISSLRESSHCRVLFISSSEESRLKPALVAAKNCGTLTVSDMPHFADKGGMIQFVPRDNKIRFEVNLPATEEAGLTLSSELLKVAVKVIGKPGN
jgi:hypothetical protein